MKPFKTAMAPVKVTAPPGFFTNEDAWVLAGVTRRGHRLDDPPLVPRGPLSSLALLDRAIDARLPVVTVDPGGDLFLMTIPDEAGFIEWSECWTRREPVQPGRGR